MGIPPHERNFAMLAVSCRVSMCSVFCAAVVSALLAGFGGVQSMAQSVSQLPAGSWRFIVSGDSRNCGDIVMPAIAEHSAQFAPKFYWHLGDLRAIYKIDEDIAFSRANEGRTLSCTTYHRLAWSDFISNQIGAFGDLPFYLGIGNHEDILPKNEDAFRREFFDWLDQPTLRQQRELDKEPAEPEPYYHWIEGGVDFINLDNASDCFSPAQMLWLTHRLEAAKTNPAVKSIVVGMHEALPESFASNHSMGDKPDEPDSYETGHKVYEALAEFSNTKPVYVLASHSHYYMENIFSTPKLTANGAKPLPGWIVGTAGAQRYAHPSEIPAAPAKTIVDTYGYLMGTVDEKGKIDFSFQEIQESDVPQYVRQRYTDKAVPWCFEHNSLNKYPKEPHQTPLCKSPYLAKCGSKK
jgi:Calcineurin-like phosphoesterase